MKRNDRLQSWSSFQKVSCSERTSISDRRHEVFGCQRYEELPLRSTSSEKSLCLQNAYARKFQTNTEQQT